MMHGGTHGRNHCSVTAQLVAQDNKPDHGLQILDIPMEFPPSKW